MSTVGKRGMPAMDVMSRGVAMEAAVVEAGMTQMVEPPREPRSHVRHLHNRHQNIVEQMVGLLIRDGKKAQAQRVCLDIDHYTRFHKRRNH